MGRFPGRRRGGGGGQGVGGRFSSSSMGGGKSKTRHGGGGGLAIDVSTFTKGENKRKIKRSTNGIDHYGLDEVEESYRSRELKNLRKTQGKGGGDFDGDLVRFTDSDDDDYGGESEEEEENRLLGLEGAENAAEVEDEDEEDEEEGEEEEEEEEEERERESRTAWGRSAKDFYGAGDDDEEDDDDENSENEETMKMREEEARVIEEEEDVEGLDEEDFGMQQLQEVVKDLQKKKKKKIQHKPTGTEEKSDTTDKTGKEDEDEEEEEDEEDLSLIDGETNTVHSLLSRLSSFSSMIPGTDAILRPRQGDNFVNLPLEDLKRLSKEERERILEESHPELQGLLAQLHTALKTVRRSIKPVLDQVKSRSFMTKEGISFLDVRNQLLCAYVMYLSYYILLKTHGIAVKDHPVIERLVEIRILLEKIRPIENRLQFQMDRLLQLAASQDKTTESEDDEEEDQERSTSTRPRPEQLLAVGDEREDDEEDEEEEESDGLDEDLRVSKKRKKKAKLEEGEEHSQVYRPPKLVAMDYPGNEQVRGVKEKAERELRRAAERLKRSELVRAVREEIGDAPEEMGVERWLQSHHSKLGMAASIAKKQKAREAFEEENMLRLSSSKKDRKERQLARKLEEEQRRMTVGTTLSELTAFTDTALGVYDDEGGEEDISIGGRGRQAGGGGRSSNALGMYLNAARQAAETAKKVDEALQTDRAIFSRQQNLLLSQLQHKKKNEETRKAHQKKRKEEDSDADYDDMLGPDSLGLSSGKKRKNKNNRTDERDDLAEPSAEDLEAFDELLQTQKSRKIAKKKQIEERAKAFVPSVPEEVEGQRATTRQILKNKGLTRKRKKVEGNARVHNRRKYEAKMRKLKTIRGGEREVEGDSYMGEESGIRANLKKSRNLSS